MMALFSICPTIALYMISKRIYRAYPRVYLSPLLITPIAVIAMMLLQHIPYESYNGGGQWLTKMIGPGTIALAVPLHKNFHVLKKHAAVILTSVSFGALMAILSSAWLARELKLDPAVIESLIPRSATTPIAMAVSGTLGGIPNITAVFVMITGLSGMVLGPPLVRLLRIHHDVARGVLFGTSSHNAGTAKAFEFGSLPGAISGIAMILTAFITLFAAPWLISILF